MNAHGEPETAWIWRKMTAAVHCQEGAFPPDDRIDWASLVPDIGPAAAALARYDKALASSPNAYLLRSTLIMHEADMSSRIEGTQATMQDALEFEAGMEPDSPAKRDDAQEVINYRDALRQAEKALETLPLCLRVLKDAHRTLLLGARGRGKDPGEFRRIQNFIGAPGASIENARYVPISAEKLTDAMSAWEKYLHADAPDPLAQIAVIHAEFEALHPFLDGNGRLGRLIVPLFLWKRELIHAPAFYISAYLETHREDYYERLLAVSRDDDWTGWVRFFLQAIQTQAKHDLAKVEAILELYNVMEFRIPNITRSKYAVHALKWIFKFPIFSSRNFVARAGIPEASARRILRVLRDDNIIEPLLEARGQQAAIYYFPKLLNITSGPYIR